MLFDALLLKKNKISMNNTTLTYVGKLLGLTAILYGVHYYIILNFFSEKELYFPLWSIYLFNAVLVLIVFGIIQYKVSKGSENAMNIFLSLTTVKMILAIVFLLPVFAGKVAHSQLEVINFFIPYFCFLAFEIFQLNNFFKKR